MRGLDRDGKKAGKAPEEGPVGARRCKGQAGSGYSFLHRAGSVSRPPLSKEKF